MRGRKRKPSALSRLDGNPGDRKILEEPKPGPLDSLEAPQWLDPLARAEWEVVAPVLAKLGLLSSVDRAALEAYCRSYSQWRAAEKALDKAKQSGRPYSLYREQVIDTVRLAERMRHYLSEFGLTPVSRMRLAQDPSGKGDDFDKFMSGKRKPKEAAQDAPSGTLH